MQLFTYAHASPVAGNVVRNVLSPDGPFSHNTFLVSKAGTRFLNYLAEADPSATLAVIERTFDTWTHEELQRWGTGRQDIVWALEKIAVWREHFLCAAQLLVKLALAKSANNANNSTGTLLSPFKTGLGWAATQAAPEERFPVIEELLRNHDRLRKELGLRANLLSSANLANEVIETWMLQNPETRVRKLLRCLPKTLDEEDGGRLTKLVLQAFGDEEDVTDFLIAYFLSGSYSGPESAYRAGQRGKARQWVSETKSGKVLAWLYRYIEALNRDIAEAELREERDF